MVKASVPRAHPDSAVAAAAPHPALVPPGRVRIPVVFTAALLCVRGAPGVRAAPPVDPTVSVRDSESPDTEAEIDATDGAPAAAKSEGPLTWIASETDAVAQSKAERRPMSLLRGQWRSACKRMARETFGDPRVKTQAGRFVAVRIDADQRTTIAGQRGALQVRGDCRPHADSVRLIGPRAAPLHRFHPARHAARGDRASPLTPRRSPRGLPTKRKTMRTRLPTSSSPLSLALLAAACAARRRQGHHRPRHREQAPVGRRAGLAARRPQGRRRRRRRRDAHLRGQGPRVPHRAPRRRSRRRRARHGHDRGLGRRLPDDLPDCLDRSGGRQGAPPPRRPGLRVPRLGLRRRRASRQRRATRASARTASSRAPRSPTTSPTGRQRQAPSTSASRKIQAIWLLPSVRVRPTTSLSPTAHSAGRGWPAGRPPRLGRRPPQEPHAIRQHHLAHGPPPRARLRRRPLQRHLHFRPGRGRLLQDSTASASSSTRSTTSRRCSARPWRSRRASRTRTATSARASAR